VVLLVDRQILVWYVVARPNYGRTRDLGYAFAGSAASRPEKRRSRHRAPRRASGSVKPRQARRRVSCEGTRERPRRRASQGFRRSCLTNLRCITKLVYDGTTVLRYSTIESSIFGFRHACSGGRHSRGRGTEGPYKCSPTFFPFPNP